MLGKGEKGRGEGKKVCLREAGLDKGWSSLRRKIYFEEWTAWWEHMGRKIAGNSGDCLGGINRAYLWKIFMAWDIWLTDVIRGYFPLHFAGMMVVKILWSFVAYETASTVAQFSLLEIEEIFSKINNLKKHERAKWLAIYGESMIEQSSMTC